MPSTIWLREPNGSLDPVPLTIDVDGVICEKIEGRIRHERCHHPSLSPFTAVAPG